MEPFDESDLKDMWDSELDETQSPKTLDESYVHDWFEDDKFKDCKVILNDKLMSDALLNGTMPIKSEHSYSLSSEGDFLQQSTSICRKRDDNNKELSSNIISRAIKVSQELSTDNNVKLPTNCLDSPTKHALANFDINLASVELPRVNPQNNNSFNRLANLVKTYSLHALEYEGDGYTDDNSNILPAAEVQKQKRQLMMQRLFANTDTRDYMLEHDWSVSTTSEDNEESVSSEFSSDVEIEDASITPITHFPVSPESHLKGMRIDETHKLLPTILNETSTKNICLPVNTKCVKSKDLVFNKIQTKTPTRTVHKLSETEDSVEENFKSPAAKKVHETYDAKLNTIIIAANKEETTKSIFNNVIPITISSKLSSGSSNSSIRQPINTPLISSQPKGSTGVLVLTEEEKRTLIAEGYPVPQQLPLSKTEEKSLKKIRRKIKNKISAQESRRKKKEYMDQLERRVDILVKENSDYKKRIEVLENANNNLLDELRRQQTIIAKEI